MGPAKAAANRRKHRVTFDEATSVFRDAFALTFDDPDHSLEERRFVTIGVSARQRVLFVSHADHRVDRIRIISARRATPSEAHAYQESRR
ncbi:MAG: BrnT family toxin [Vicinamibacterales bacterium]